MAYKFQLGAAKLGGAITSTGTISGSVVDSQGALSGASIQVDDVGGIAGTALVNNGGVLDVSGVSNDEIASNAAIAFSKLASLSAGNILVGDGSNVAASVAMSGDISISAAGSTSIGSGKVTNAMLSGAIELSKLETVTAADIIVANGSGVPTAVAMSGDISITAAGSTSIGDGKVTNAMLSGAVAAGKLQLGDGLADSSDLLVVDLNTNSGLEFSGGKLQVDLASANALELDASGLDLKSTIAGSRTFSNDVTVNGNFTVLGSTFSASVGTLIIEDALINVGDGSSAFAQDYGIQFGSAGSEWASLKTDSDAGFNNLSSSLPLLAPSLATDDWSITSTHISGNLPVSASAFYGDGSGLTGISADSATSLRLAGANAIVNSNITASNDVNLVDTSGARTIEMPDINSSTVGRVYIIKDIVGSAATNNITINDSTSGHDIDGETSITIESDFGAVNLLAVSGAAGFSYIIF